MTARRRTPPAAAPTGPLLMSEADWQRRVVDTARRLGWRVCHIRNVKVGRGASTRYLVPYEGDGGLPDLILAKAGRVLLVELKAEKGGFKPGQVDWLRAAGPNGYCWRPSDWPTVQAVLRGEPVPGLLTYQLADPVRPSSDDHHTTGEG